MDAGERGKNPFLTDRVPAMELGKRGLHQLSQKGHRPHRHPLLQRFRRNVHRLIEVPRLSLASWPVAPPWFFAALHRPKVTKARNSFPVIFDVRCTNLVRSWALVFNLVG